MRAEWRFRDAADDAQTPSTPPASGGSTTKSAPLRRATISLACAEFTRRRATLISTWSPIACSSDSLMCLRWSRSTNTTATGWLDHCARTMAWLSRSASKRGSADRSKVRNDSSGTQRNQAHAQDNLNPSLDRAGRHYAHSRCAGLAQTVPVCPARTDDSNRGHPFGGHIDYPAFAISKRCRRENFSENCPRHLLEQWSRLL